MIRNTRLSLFLFVSLLLALGASVATAGVEQQSVTPLRRVNVPFWSGTDTPPESRRAVFWFGEVTPTSNYADGRIVYNDRALFVTFQIFDRDLWFANPPGPDELTRWDAVSLYLDLAGNSGSQPGSSSYRFVAQLHNQQEDALYQSAAQGNGVGWTARALPFTTDTFWRGEGLNDGSADRGWVAVFEIPFSSLGLSGRPAYDTRWGLAVALHDRDDQAGTARPVQRWPETSNELAPSTWGELRFGLPGFSPPLVTNRTVTTIRHGQNGAVVEDAHVGGHANCGQPAGPVFFPSWGSLNYAGYEQINIQNQWDAADWPCFSRYYITFPLDALPPGKTIQQAILTLNQFGNASPAQAVPSFIHVLTVGEDWDETTINWNNAPLAAENVTATVVNPIPGGHSPWPGTPRQWIVSKAVADAYAAGQPLRLVLYSSDGAYHSGKYFHASDADVAGRPVLRITWGDLSNLELDNHMLVPFVLGGSVFIAWPARRRLALWRSSSPER